jgi:hypothetical protein
MVYQRTIAKEVKVTGIGLHSGKKVTMKLISGFSMLLLHTKGLVHCQWL